MLWAREMNATLNTKKSPGLRYCLRTSLESVSTELLRNDVYAYHL